MTAAETEALRERLRARLWEVGHASVPPTEAAQRARNAAMDAIRRQLDQLPPKPYAPIGMEYGQVTVLHLLGSEPARPEMPEPEAHEREDYNPFDEASQWWRQR
jgi:hypothetical protein